MKLFKVFLSFFLIVAVLWGGSFLFPRTYKVERSILINKPASDVYDFMNDLRNWEKWSLWNKETDSTLQFFYGTRSDSVGGRQYFNGTLLGIGRFRIAASIPAKQVRYELYMHGGNVNASGLFRMQISDSNTTVLHWIDSGDVGNNPVYRYMLPSKISSTEKAFDDGLARIKQVLEK
jgi:hypothetical protein